MCTIFFFLLSLLIRHPSSPLVSFFADANLMHTIDVPKITRRRRRREENNNKKRTATKREEVHIAFRCVWYHFLSTHLQVNKWLPLGHSRRNKGDNRLGLPRLGCKKDDWYFRLQCNTSELSRLCIFLCIVHQWVSLWAPRRCQVMKSKTLGLRQSAHYQTKGGRRNHKMIDGDV